ncbi:hypothetical protein SCMU_33350 [Sinomonas cyclohexanicum]|uniref:NUDIX hydrolase n=1 Tax=Sinomonas cyclohexanicum TaxID=322009 RepID=A0ABN6FL72_SINCY|nr:hypothetical protein [Corynebacterium cyclohexanicum]BCT77493.1 hypothetical protein SCMU_33350 [Corynebacterium cyclohexanicum]
MPTSYKRRFTLPRHLQGAARSWLEEADRAPRKPRLASTVALVRDAPDGTETWLTYRTGDSPLGVVAFPGGSVENADQDSFDWFGPSVGQWSELLGTDDYALARVHVVAAIRELFEETGVLLAGSDESVVVEGTSTADWVRAREALANQEIGFAGPPVQARPRAPHGPAPLARPLGDPRVRAPALRHALLRGDPAGGPDAHAPAEQGRVGAVGERGQGRRRA